MFEDNPQRDLVMENMLFIVLAFALVSMQGGEGTTKQAH